MEIQPVSRDNAFTVTTRSRPASLLASFPPEALAAERGPISPLAPAYLEPDRGLALDRLLGALAGSGTEYRSKARLAIDTASAERASRLTGIGELNPDTTSFSKVRLTFGDASTVATLSGTYAAGGAAASATSLKLEFTGAASIGHDEGPLQFRVLDQNGSELFVYNGTARAAEAISLGSDIGLSVSFSAGNAAAQASAQTSVSASSATTVDRFARFDDADPNNRPRFANGAQVVAGSFAINGRTIEVRTGDSLASVIQRITEEVPGIDARVTGDKVVLETRSDSTREITIGNDTSGFVSAAQLQGALTDRGHVRGDREPLAQLSQFAAVRSGSFTVNGTSISVDPAKDSLAVTLARIRDLGTSVQAYYDPSQRAVFLREPDSGTVLGDDTSGFLAAVGISREPAPPSEPPFQLASHTASNVAQRIAQLLDGNLVGLMAETRKEPEPRLTLDRPDAASRAQAAYARTAPDSPAYSPSATRSRPAFLAV